MTRLQSVRDCLKNESNEIILDDEQIARAKKSLDRMIAF